LTRNFFEEYILRLNDDLILINRKILILCDNFSGHFIKNKSHVKLLFFPPNCTSIIQSLDMGIINSFKTKFRQMLTKFQVYSGLTHDLNQSESLKKVHLMNVVLWITKSHKYVTNETIKNCWGKSGLLDYENCTKRL
ncbi:Tigger transposable element-derived protein 6, partial [Dictyocoela muelleri]